MYLKMLRLVAETGAVDSRSMMLTELDMEVELCDGNEPLVNAATGRLFNCDEEACPSSSYCHRVPHQPARCCLGGLLTLL